jgi:hypothetical protein
MFPPDNAFVRGFVKAGRFTSMSFPMPTDPQQARNSIQRYNVPAPLAKTQPD